MDRRHMPWGPPPGGGRHGDERRGWRAEGRVEGRGEGRFEGRGEGGPGFGPRGGPGWAWRGRGDHGGPPFGRGPGRGFGRGPRVGRGDVRLALLALLAEGPRHGYQLIQEIGERSGGVWQPSPGSVYPALQLLEDEGLIRAEQAEARRVFQLTDAGRTYSKEHAEELAGVWGAVTGTVDDSLVELRDLFMQVGAAVRQVAHAGSRAEIAEARQLLINTRRQLYRILADAEPAGKPTGQASASESAAAQPPASEPGRDEGALH